MSGASVTITTPSNGVTTTVQVTYGEVKQVEVDRVAVELRGSVKGDKAVHITSDVEIVVYGVFAELASSDAYLALPTDVLGTEYFTPCASIQRASPAEFGVVGVQDGTTVTIVPSQAVTFDGQNYTAGQAFSVGLNRFETLQVQAMQDLTGSKITATQPVAVLSGNQFAVCMPVGQKQKGSGDYVVEMIPPVDTWGKEFVTVPLTKHTGGDLFRVVAARDNTRVDITNENTKSLHAGEFLEIDVPSDEYRHVTSSEPVLLVQYSKTADADKTDTDPFMMVIPPVAQFEAEYTFSTVDLIQNRTNTTHHINLVMSYGFVRPESYGYPGGLRLARIAALCSTTAPVPADRVDNDCDGRVDEELLNGIDDDGDGLIDEDLATSNCADNRDQYRTCLRDRCRNLVP
ncbi:IgGFc-binding protein-like [Branchiostoma lanceolatum]|uniref:IgGFc-binding protein-like n=1 Tax=Branchiostoma lanceolatum TaxID=7740 RepID=UPI003454FC77